MKKDIKNKIAEYKFKDSKQMTWAIGSGNLILALLLLSPDWTNIYSDPRTITCFMLAGFFIVVSIFHTWLSPEFNAYLAALYLSVFLFEMLQLGIPESAIAFSNKGISKGLMFDLMVGLFPYIYIGLRLFLIIPLIYITVTSYKLKRVNISTPQSSL